MELLVLLPDQSLSFSSSDHMKHKILKYVIQSTSKVVVIDGRNIRTIDATVAKVSQFTSLPSNYSIFCHVRNKNYPLFVLQSMCEVVDDLHVLGRQVYFWHWSKEPMGVLCRLRPEAFSYFKDAQTEDELMKSLNVECVNNGFSGDHDRHWMLLCFWFVFEIEK